MREAQTEVILNVIAALLFTHNHIQMRFLTQSHTHTFCSTGLGGMMGMPPGMNSMDMMGGGMNGMGGMNSMDMMGGMNSMNGLGGMNGMHPGVLQGMGGLGRIPEEEEEDMFKVGVFCVCVCCALSVCVCVCTRQVGSVQVV